MHTITNNRKQQLVIFNSFFANPLENMGAITSIKKSMIPIIRNHLKENKKSSLLFFWPNKKTMKALESVNIATPEVTMNIKSFIRFSIKFCIISIFVFLNCDINIYVLQYSFLQKKQGRRFPCF